MVDQLELQIRSSRLWKTFLATLMRLFYESVPGDGTKGKGERLVAVRKEAEQYWRLQVRNGRIKAVQQIQMRAGRFGKDF